MARPLVPLHDESSPKWTASHHWRIGRESAYPICCILWFLVRAQIVERWAGCVVDAETHCLRRLPLTSLYTWMAGDTTVRCGYVRCPWCRAIGKVGETNTVRQWLHDSMMREHQESLARDEHAK
ncbi:MAG TPA: hypothetical protein DCP69_05000 [Candidatus Omnitrophica bacterium]|nr:hypothetical protein [Candidatus Omnitrophota bacterium]